MRKLILAVTVCAFAGIVVVETASAQTGIGIGPRVGYDVGGDVESPFVGVDLRFNIPVLPIELGAFYDYYITGDDPSVSQFGLNAFYTFGLVPVLFTPYAGAGVGMASTGGNTDTGLNLIFGARFGMPVIAPFVQAQYTLGGDIDFVTLAAGFHLRF
jgi:hypothetical protein